MIFDLKILKMSPELFARGYVQKALRIRLSILPKLLFTKTLPYGYDVVMTFESLQLMPFGLEKSRVKKMMF